MKIALLHHAAHPVVGGVESIIRQHSRLMARAGHTVLIVAGRGGRVDEGTDFLSMPLLDSIDPRILALKASLDGGSIPAGFGAVSAEIESGLREHLSTFDWLIAHNVCSLNKNLALTAALRRMTPGQAPRLMLWHHDLAWTTPRYRAELHDGEPWDLLRKDWPEVVQVTVSDARRRELASLMGVPLTRIEVVPNGIDPLHFLDIDAWTASLINKMDLLGADPLLLMPARVTPRKNVEMALRILAAVLINKPKAKLVVTGPTGAHNPQNLAYLDSLTRLRRELAIGAQAIFLAAEMEAVPTDAAMRQLYRLADAVLLPSREEGFGIPILEAALAGIPVFCSDIPPFTELGRDQVTTFPLDGDPVTVAQILSNTLANDPRQGLRKRVVQEYSWTRVYETRIVPLLEHAAR